MMVVHRLMSWENVNNWSCYCCCCIDRTLLMDWMSECLLRSLDLLEK